MYDCFFFFSFFLFSFLVYKQLINCSSTVKYLNISDLLKLNFTYSFPKVEEFLIYICHISSELWSHQVSLKKMRLTLTYQRLHPQTNCIVSLELQPTIQNKFFCSLAFKNAFKADCPYLKIDSCYDFDNLSCPMI